MDIDMDIILSRFKQCFNEIPPNDSRAKIGPRLFVIALIFSLSTKDKRQRSLESLRISVMNFTGKLISRGSFWERLVTKRLVDILLSLLGESIRQMSSLTVGLDQTTSLLKTLNVKSILILDSTSITVPQQAGIAFPGPRNNTSPGVIKWHSCFDLFQGTVKWFDLSPGTSHDQNHFPSLKTLKGYLIIFDLGYFDCSLLQAIDNIGGYFLCRFKMDTMVQVAKVIQGLPKKFEGQYLFSKRIPKGRQIIEVSGLFKEGLFQFRLVGFWNPIDKRYHWYVTNLAVPSELIYPLYRLRWQCELLFKTAKSSLNLSNMPSADLNIIQSLVLGSIVLTTFMQPLTLTAAFLHLKDKSYFQWPSLQRAGVVIHKLSDDFKAFLISKEPKAKRRLVDKLMFFSTELFDPNRKRDSSMQRVIKEAGIWG